MALHAMLVTMYQVYLDEQINSRVLIFMRTFLFLTTTTRMVTFFFALFALRSFTSNCTCYLCVHRRLRLCQHISLFLAKRV